MTKINWARFITGGLIAAVIMFVADGFMHEMILKSDWQDIYRGINATQPEGHGSSMLYFFIFELGRGMLAMLLYVLMRTVRGAGPLTAVIAGVATWLVFSFAGPAQFIPLGFYSNMLWAKVAAFQLVTTIVAVLAAAALYRDAASTETPSDRLE